MWARTLRLGRRSALSHLRPRPVALRRDYNGPFRTPHTTYFNEPPTRSRIRRALFLLVFGGTSFVLGATAETLAGLADIQGLAEREEALREGLIADIHEFVMRFPVAMSLECASVLMRTRCNCTVSPTVVTHTCQLASNTLIEDTGSTGTFALLEDHDKNWLEFSIFDGHAGVRTAQRLADDLPAAVGMALWEAGCMEQAYVPNDWHTVNTIKKAFRNFDDEMIQRAANALQSANDFTTALATASEVFSGSCALMALYDPHQSVLRVANVGDSRAVLGRWDGQKYVAKPMSIDHTGFNPKEVARLTRDHPGEDKIVDPKTGRIHGIAVSRAFGDSRWKWPEHLTKLAYETFWGPSPRPNGAIKTPPYLTAEPDVMETRVQTGAHPDFLIMASDGLWDHISSEDAVTCVQMWLEKNKPTDILETEVVAQPDWPGHVLKFPDLSNDKSPSINPGPEVDEDVYFDENEQRLKWRVSPEHFVVEDDQCAIHLIKNALGGKRRNLFLGLLTLQPPLSRNVRDDITVHVIFFGMNVDTSKTAS